MSRRAREGALDKFSPARCAGKRTPGFGGREGGHHKMPMRREIFKAAASARWRDALGATFLHSLSA